MTSPLRITGLLILSCTAVLSVDTPPATLYWRNNESLPGELVSADAASITWKTGLVGAPAVLDRSRLLLVDFARPGNPEPNKATWSLLLRNGDCINGNDARLGIDAITMVCPRHGVLTVPLSEARSLRRLRGEDLLYAGPCGQAGWKGAGFTTDGGALATRNWDETLELPLELPDKVAVDLGMRSTKLLNFKLALTQHSHSCPSIETWGSDLVLVAPGDSMHFTPLLKLKEGEPGLALKLFLDQEAGNAQVFDRAGKELGSLHWTVSPAPSAPPASFAASPSPLRPRMRSGTAAPVPGIAIKNRGANWVVDELCVRRWDGRLPQPSPDSLPRVELTDGTWRSGAVVKDVDLAAVQSLVWSAEVPPLQPKVPRPAVTFADGTTITGTLVSFAGSSLDLKTSWSAAPVRSWAEGLLRIVFEPPASPVEEPSLGTLDKLRQGAVHIHGSISGNGGKEPLWRFVGGRDALPIVIPSKREDVDLVWAVPAKVEPATSFIITDSGEVLNASLTAIDDTGVTFTSPWTPMQTLAHEHMRAIRMGAHSQESKGFRDSGWASFKGADSTAKVVPGAKPEKDVLHLEPGGVFGHPGMVHGNEIRFSMKAPTHYGGLGVDLFAADGDAAQGALRLTLWHTGNQLYVVAGDSNSGVRRDQTLRGTSDAAINIKITFKDSKVQVLANETVLLNQPVTAAQRQQSGLRFYCASMWGNSLSPMDVSDFSVGEHLGELSALNVPDKARQDALLVPRFRRETPPSHALVAENGDVIRGRVDAATARLVRFSSGLETTDVPAERVQNIIWLRKPRPDPKTGNAPPASLAAIPPPAPGSHWLVLHDKSHLALEADSFEADKMLGRSALLGRFELPLTKISMIRWAPPPSSPALKSYTDWQLENAPEPVLPESGSQASPLLGKAGPVFKLPLLEGGEFDLSEMRGQVVVIDFWATWCGPCVSSMPDLIKVMKTFEGRKVRFITLNQGEPAAQMQHFLKLREWKLPVALDAQQEVARKYGVEGIPHTVIIGVGGKVEWTHTGFSSGGADKLSEAVKKALHEP